MLIVDAPDPNPTGRAGAVSRGCRLAKGTKEVNLDQGKVTSATGLFVAHMSLCSLRYLRPQANFRSTADVPVYDTPAAQRGTWLSKRASDPNMLKRIGALDFIFTAGETMQCVRRSKRGAVTTSLQPSQAQARPRSSTTHGKFDNA
ncbi:hypothetical protein AN191_13060 [Loktanella sp. 5RATIMAR09]|nr:hypothetical protein AN191_13060 [Loktanella sp. 5RATIMAR09]